jgi:hypothetical protein
MIMGSNSGIVGKTWSQSRSFLVSFAGRFAWWRARTMLTR